MVERYRLGVTPGEPGPEGEADVEAIAVAATLLMSGVRSAALPVESRKANWQEEQTEDESRYFDAL